MVFSPIYTKNVYVWKHFLWGYYYFQFKPLRKYHKYIRFDQGILQGESAVSAILPYCTSRIFFFAMSASKFCLA